MRRIERAVTPEPLPKHLRELLAKLPPHIRELLATLPANMSRRVGAEVTTR